MMGHFKLPLLVAITCLGVTTIQASFTAFDDEVTNNPHYMEKITRYAKAAEIHNYLNESYNPCKNFYRFACGKYYKLNPPTSPPYTIDPLSSLSNAMGRKYLSMLKAERADTASPSERKVKDFYESCLKSMVAKASYSRKLKELFNEFGGMPALEGNSWREADFDWLKTVAEIYHKYGLSIIVGQQVSSTYDDNTVNRLIIKTQAIPLESVTLYTDDNYSYKLLRNGRLKSMARALHTDLGLNNRKAEQVAKEIFNFETLLFAGNEDEDDDASDEELEDDSPKTDSEEIKEYYSNLTTIEEMHTKYYPDLDIKRLVNISLGHIPSDKVMDFIADDFENIVYAINNTAKRIVANYIFFYLLEDIKVPGWRNQKREEACLTITKQYFSDVLDNMVYRKYTTKQTEQDINHMWQVIRTTFQNILQSNKLHWIKAETRQLALRKLSAMTLEINSYKKTNLTQLYAELHINKHDYVENIKSILNFNARKTRNMLRQTPEPYDDPSTMSFTPVYILSENRIKVPVGVLQPYHLWSDYYPNALKFGTLGFLIAHELIHGFDQEGRFFGKTGNLEKWWDRNSSLNFANRTDCFSKQYQKFWFHGSHLPELSSQSENIADNGGIRLAYEAYSNWYENALRLRQNIDKETLPRLNYTSRQLFFLSYGQLWCKAEHEVFSQVLAATDNHAPSEFRVVGPLSNLEEFAKEFNCPKGTPMNPKKQCIIY